MGTRILSAMFLAGALFCVQGYAAAQNGASTPNVSLGISTGNAGIQWVRIPGGTFTMGSDKSDEKDQTPAHRVTIKSFEMTKTLVTNKQYKACVAAGACRAAHVSDGSCDVFHNKGGWWMPDNLPESFQGDDQPVVCVDWDQARAFSAWVGGRLPSEAEWDYASRSAGKDQIYPWGNARATCDRAAVWGCGHATTLPVCSRPAGNTLQGLCDMAGNVGEWLEDSRHRSYEGAPADGSAWKDAGISQEIRSVDWSHGAGYAQSARRSSGTANVPGSTVGFRVARGGIAVSWPPIPSALEPDGPDLQNFKKSIECGATDLFSRKAFEALIRNEIDEFGVTEDGQFARTSIQRAPLRKKFLDSDDRSPAATVAQYEKAKKYFSVDSEAFDSKHYRHGLFWTLVEVYLKSPATRSAVAKCEIPLGGKGGSGLNARESIDFPYVDIPGKEANVGKIRINSSYVRDGGSWRWTSAEIAITIDDHRANVVESAWIRAEREPLPDSRP